jgi:hypothetical protein
MMNCTDSKGQPKRRYGSEYEALDAAACGRVERGVDLRVYRCPNCGGWHLTSRQARDGRWERESPRW